MPESEATFVRLPKNIKKISKHFAENGLNMTLSEYIRSLVVKDLDNRSIITTEYKKGD